VTRGFATIDRRSFELAALASCVVLAALGVWLLARLIWLLVPRGDALLEGGSMHVASGGGPAPAQSIAKWHLFGNTPPIAGSGPGAPATTLGMILRGTLADRDPAAGIAVISEGERGERAYRAGEAIAGGVKLARVYPDHVVLLHEGVEETLTLTRDRNFAPGDIVRPPTAGDARNPTAKNTPASIAAANAAAASAAATGTARAPADWQQTVDRLRQNPDELTKRVQIVPVVDGGRLTGVRVAAGSDMTLINQIGLRAGDVVTAINGAPVDSLAREQQIVESLRSASSARVTVLRDGKPTDVTIALK
jgi:general secretion pathway protein C